MLGGVQKTVTDCTTDLTRARRELLRCCFQDSTPTRLPMSATDHSKSAGFAFAPVPAVSGAVIACPDCDLLQHEIVLPAKGMALCGRCGAHLYRDTPNGLDRALACAVACVILFLLANAFPLIDLELQGSRNSTSLFGAASALYREDMVWLALLVVTTTILIPAIELGAMLYLLLPLRLGMRVPGLLRVFRFVQTLQPWSMVEVFMLGVMVSVVKLAHFANVKPGVALWSIAGVMVLMAAMAHAFNPRDMWARLAELGP